MEGNEYILNLDDLVEAPGYFQLGERYDYRPWGSFGLLAQRRYERDWRRVLEIEAKDVDELDEAIEAEHDGLLRALIVTLSTMTPEAAATERVDRLGLACMGFFIWRSQGVMAAATSVTNALPTSATETETTPEDPTGETSSPDATTTGRKRTRKSG